MSRSAVPRVRKPPKRGCKSKRLSPICPRPTAMAAGLWLTAHISPSQRDMSMGKLAGKDQGRHPQKDQGSARRIHGVAVPQKKFKVETELAEQRILVELSPTARLTRVRRH
ncbi:hypothetical protein DFAR_2520008 [Desulfarculales bacterium]